MGNVYSAQNIASYLIFELKERSFTLTKQQLQSLLRTVDMNWMNIFGNRACQEKPHTNEIFYIEEVYSTYNEQFKQNQITEPAKEWFLSYGQFQLVYQAYKVPAFSQLEKFVIQQVLENFLQSQLEQAS